MAPPFRRTATHSPLCGVYGPALSQVEIENALNGATNGATTGTGALVRSVSPTLVTPDLGTPSAVVLTNATGLPVGGISATGTPDSTTFLRGDGVWDAPAGATVPQSSGVLTGGALSIGTGGAGVATTFTIASGTGQIVDNTVNPPTNTAVSWSAQTDVAVTDILTQLVTFVAIDSGGNVIQSATDFTPAQQREYIVIGVAVHSNQTTVNAVNQTHVVAYAPGAQTNDLMYALGLFNVSGNIFTANGANLKLNKSAGSLFRRGANYSSLSTNPHVITTGSLTQAPLRMQNQTGAGSASTTDVDVANYDVAGVTTAISPATRFSILRVFLFQSNLIAVQRGQATYLSLAEAKAAIQTETFVTNSILAANGLLRGFIVAQANASSLSDASKVFFIEAGRFGGSSGVGGLSVSTVQNAYDNGSTPELLTDSTRGALTLRRGSAADTDTVLEVQTGAAATSFSVTGDGVVTGVLTSATGLPLSTGVTGTLPVANGGTGDTGTAWTTYTPTLAASAGAFVTATASGAYKTIGKTLFIRLAVVVTDVGTASGYMTLTAPVGVTPFADNQALGYLDSIVGVGSAGWVQALPAFGIAPSAALGNNTYTATGAIELA